MDFLVSQMDEVDMVSREFSRALKKRYGPESQEEKKSGVCAF
jgi:hypothetical protein